MLRPIDEYFLKQQEPARSCLQFLRNHILELDVHISESWKYGMPFYCYGKRMFCYLWVHKKYRQPYLGIVPGNLVHHPDLLVEKRSRMKILLIDADSDLPMEKINGILQELLVLYRD